VTESQPAPALVAAGIEQPVNMEGKEVRFGVPSSVAWAGQTTGASNGSGETSSA